MTLLKGQLTQLHQSFTLARHQMSRPYIILCWPQSRVKGSDIRRRIQKGVGENKGLDHAQEALMLPTSGSTLHDHVLYMTMCFTLFFIFFFHASSSIWKHSCSWFWGQAGVSHHLLQDILYGSLLKRQVQPCIGGPSSTPYFEIRDQHRED